MCTTSRCIRSMNLFVAQPFLLTHFTGTTKRFSVHRLFFSALGFIPTFGSCHNWTQATYVHCTRDCECYVILILNNVRDQLGLLWATHTEQLYDITTYLARDLEFGEAHSVTSNRAILYEDCAPPLSLTLTPRAYYNLHNIYLVYSPHLGETHGTEEQPSSSAPSCFPTLPWPCKNSSVIHSRLEI